MNKSILPLSKPFVSMTWAPYNYILSIAQSKHTFINWFLNNTINIVAIDGDEACTPFTRYLLSPEPSTKYASGNIWDVCPFVHKLTVDQDFITYQSSSKVDFLLNSLNNGFYIYIYLLLPFEYVKFAHQTLIYGYDKLEDKVYLADHFDQGRYSFLTIKLNELIETLNINSFNVLEYESIRSNFVYAIKPFDYTYDFDVELMIKSLNDYVNATNTTISNLHFTDVNKNMYKDKHYYGIDVYEVVIFFLEREMAKTNRNLKDCRSLTFIYETKILFNNLLIFIEKNIKTLDKALIQEANSMVKFARMILNVYIKYTISNDVELLSIVIDKIKILKNTDYIIHNKLLNALSN